MHMDLRVSLIHNFVFIATFLVHFFFTIKEYMFINALEKGLLVIKIKQTANVDGTYTKYSISDFKKN